MAPSQFTFLIKLDDNQNKFYTAGDKVSGRVCLSSTEDMGVGNVSIRLYGRSKTKIIRRHGNSSTTYRGRNVLFWKQLNLFNGRHKHKSPKLEWPFEFDLPYTAQNVPHGDRWDEDGGFLNSSRYAEMPLPSEMFAEGGFSQNWECRVEYVLEASLTDPESTFFGNHEAEKRLRFVQTTSPDDVSQFAPRMLTFETTGNFQVQSYKVDPQNENRQLSFKEKAKSALSFSSVPSTTFSVILEAPKVTRFGESQTLNLRLKYNEAADGTSFTPEVALRSSRIRIRATTAVRSARERISMPHSENDNSFEISTGDPRTWSGPFSKENDHSKTVKLANLALVLRAVPTFRTCNISRRYSLRIDFRFECCGKDFDLKTERELVILPALRREDPTPVYSAENHDLVPSASTQDVYNSSAVDETLETPEEPLPPYKG